MNWEAVKQNPKVQMAWKLGLAYLAGAHGPAVSKVVESNGPAALDLLVKVLGG